MARQLHTTLELRGELVAQGPLHIGGAQTGLVIDMPMATDGQGRHHIPGTSLAGALRQWMRQHLPEVDDNALWGGNAPDSPASRVVVDNAPLCDASPVRAEIWHGVGLNRRTQTAMAGIKFDREVLPKGSRFSFSMAVDTLSDAERLEARHVLGQLAAALQRGDIRFGAASTRGMGELWLEKANGHETRWNTCAGVLEHLGGKEKPDQLPTWKALSKDLPQAQPGNGRMLEITLHWKALSPLMCKAAVDGLEVDQLPMTSATGPDTLTPVLPGSAIKGALRSQAERIMRTVLGRSLAEEPTQASHMDQIDLPLVRELFGAPRSTNAAGAATGQRGALRVATCYARESLSRSQWQALAHDPAFWKNKPPAWLQRAHHVALDRWTSSPVNGALYSAVEPRTTWEPIRLSLALNQDPARFALLWQVLRDMAAGRLTLGFGANRGYGEVALERITLSGLPIPEADAVEIAVNAQRLQVPAGAFADWLAGPCTTAWTQRLETLRPAHRHA